MVKFPHRKTNADKIKERQEKIILERLRHVHARVKEEREIEEARISAEEDFNRRQQKQFAQHEKEYEAIRKRAHA